MKGHWIYYSRAELAFVERNCTLTMTELYAAFFKRFGRLDVTASHLNSLRKRKGWSTGRTGQFEKGLVPHNKGKPFPAGKSAGAKKNQFKKGNQPHNTNYLYHERVSKDGYVEISIDETNPHTGFERRYVLKHRWLWEKQHGAVPEGMCLKCLGERQNTDPSNWELVPRSMLPRLDGRWGYKYEDAPGELRPTIMAAAKVKDKIQKKRAPAQRSPQENVDG